MQVVEYASSIGQGKAASRAVDVCLRYIHEDTCPIVCLIDLALFVTTVCCFPRALEDFNWLLWKPRSDASTSTKAMRRKINTTLKALKKYYTK